MKRKSFKLFSIDLDWVSFSSPEQLQQFAEHIYWVASSRPGGSPLLVCSELQRFAMVEAYDQRDSDS